MRPRFGWKETNVNRTCHAWNYVLVFIILVLLIYHEYQICEQLFVSILNVFQSFVLVKFNQLGGRGDLAKIFL